jgi:hypothetical protein
VYGVSLPTLGSRLIPMMVAIAAVAGAPQASSAGPTSARLQASLVVLPSCNVFFSDARHEHAVIGPPRVTCTGNLAAQSDYSRERLPASAFLPKTPEHAVRPATDERKGSSVVTLYFF